MFYFDLQNESEGLKRTCRDDDVKSAVQDKHTVDQDEVQVILCQPSQAVGQLSLHLSFLGVHRKCKDSGLMLNLLLFDWIR